jgi:hypothetical protein
LDLTPWTLAKTFGNFTVPVTEEGFEDIRYSWSNKTKCAEYLKDWISTLKLTTRVEDLTPSQWFQQQWTDWHQQRQKWQMKHREWKDPRRNNAVKEAEHKEGGEDEQKDEEMDKKDEGSEKKEDEKDMTVDEEKKNGDEGLWSRGCLRHWQGGAALLQLHFRGLGIDEPPCRNSPYGTCLPKGCERPRAPRNSLGQLSVLLQQVF